MFLWQTLEFNYIAASGLILICTHKISIINLSQTQKALLIQLYHFLFMNVQFKSFGASPLLKFVDMRLK